MKTQDPTKKVFETLAFQYLPIEKNLLKLLKSDNSDNSKYLLKMYKTGSYATKIKMLDYHASNWLKLS